MKGGWLLRLYPRWWRARYGAEFQALLDDLPYSPRVVVDTLADALDARLQPALPPDPRPSETPQQEKPAPSSEQPPVRGRDRGLGPIEREIGIDRVIRDAIERGDFDDLPGAGKPLDLSAYDINNDWRLAFHVLKQVGETVPWIALGKEIEGDQQQLSNVLQMAAAEHARGLDDGARRRWRARYLEQTARLDGLVARYNRQIPSIQLERARLPAHAAAARFDAVWPPPR